MTKPSNDIFMRLDADMARLGLRPAADQHTETAPPLPPHHPPPTYTTEHPDHV